MRPRSVLAAVIVLFAALTALPARADTVFSNFGPGMSFTAGSGWSVGTETLVGTVVNVVQAAPFTPTGAFQFTDAQVAVELSTGSTPFSAFLETDSGGLPGVILDTLTLSSGTIGAVPSIVTYSCVACPNLTSGTPYWLVLLESDPNAFGGWNFCSGTSNCVSTPASNGSGSATGPWVTTPTRLGTGAFEIDGSSGLAVPEPGTLFLLGSSFAGLAFWRKRRATQPR